MSYIEQDFGIPGEVDSFSAGTTGFTPNTPTSGDIVLAGTLIAANGGTGFSSYAVGDIVYANTTTTLGKLADVATGNALISGGVGTAPAWGKIGLTTHITGILAGANGGTGVANTGKTITLGGSLATAGAFDSVFTMTGATGVTFPTTGTLATTTDLGAYVPLAGGTMTGPLIINGSGLTPLSISSTDAGAALGPIIDAYRNSASPAAADVIGGVNFTGNSSTGVKRIFAGVQGTIVTATNAAEDGSLTFYTMKAGALTLAATLSKDGNLSLESAAGISLTGGGGLTQNGANVQANGIRFNDGTAARGYLIAEGSGDGLFQWLINGAGNTGVTISVATADTFKVRNKANSADGTITFLTQSALDNSNKGATTAYVDRAAVTNDGATTFLGSDVTLNNTANFFSGPNTGSIGASGQKWLIMATGALTDTAGGANCELAIFDGTNYIADTPVFVSVATANVSGSLSVVVTLSAATTFTLRAKDQTLTTGKLLTTGVASGAANVATSITAIRLT